MKKLFTLALLTAFFSPGSFATNHIIIAEDYQFIPDSLNCTVGDTITWQFESGTGETTEHEPESINIPAGAPTWNFIINGTTKTGFTVATKAGTYNYNCYFHYLMGMVGKFVASAVTGIPAVEENTPVKIFPMPFKNNLTINVGNNPAFSSGVNIEVNDILGQRKYYMNYTENSSVPITLDLSDLSPGLYFMSLIYGDTRKTYRIIKSE